MTAVLDKERIIARPGFNRWLVPPAALAIHLSIGMAYGFSVFWLPLSKAVGIHTPIPFPEAMGFWGRVFTISHDWSISMLGWMYTLFFVFLGGSAAVFGRWVERAGPRRAGVVAACCWGGGLALSSLGVFVHQIWLLWGVLCLNVSAGIGVIGMASPMLQEVFGGQLIGTDVPLERLAPHQAGQVASIAAAFAGLLSLFNIVGRIAWAAWSDYLGR